LTALCIDQLARTGIALHRVLGLPLAGLTRITYTRELPPGARLLWTPDDALWEQLRQSPTASAGRSGQDEGALARHPEYDCWECFESERCKCSYCRHFPCTTIGQG
jgi:hypothetical protein